MRVRRLRACQRAATGTVTRLPLTEEQRVAKCRPYRLSLGAVAAIAADAGYYSATNVEACADVAITPYVAMRRDAHHTWLSALLQQDSPEPPPDATEVEQMAYRLQTKEGRKLYAKRKSTVETVFGIVKSVMGIRGFLLRGQENVNGEWTLICLAYNLKRLRGLVAASPKRVAWA